MPTINPATFKSNKFLAIDGDYRVVDGASAVADLLNYDPATGDVTYSAPTGSGANTRTHRFARPMVSTSTIEATTFTGALVGNVTGNVTGSSGSCTGLSATATTLATARTIWGQSFNGSAAISGAITGATTGAFSGAVTLSSTLAVGSQTTAATNTPNITNLGGQYSSGLATSPAMVKFQVYRSTSGDAAHGFAATGAGFQFFGGTGADFIWTTNNDGTEKMRLAIGGGLTVKSLAGTGTRTVVVDANGLLSAP